MYSVHDSASYSVSVFLSLSGFSNQTHSLNMPRRTDGGRGGFDILSIDRVLLLFTPLGKKKKALLFKHALARPSLSLSVSLPTACHGDSSPGKGGSAADAGEPAGVAVPHDGGGGHHHRMLAGRLHHQLQQQQH
jgi:hypothetical protein